MPTAFIEHLTIIYLNYGYALVFIGNLIDTSPLGWLVPGGILVAMGGFFANGTHLSLLGIYVASTLGMMASLYITYFIGRKTGMKLAQLVHQEKMAEKASALLKKHSASILVTSLLANFTRFWIAYVAGIKKFDLKIFSIYGLVTSLIWNALLVGVGFGAGNNRDKLDSNVASIGVLAWLFLIVAVAVIYWKIESEFKKEKKF